MGIDANSAIVSSTQRYFIKPLLVFDTSDLYNDGICKRILKNCFFQVNKVCSHNHRKDVRNRWGSPGYSVDRNEVNVSAVFVNIGMRRGMCPLCLPGSYAYCSEVTPFLLKDVYKKRFLNNNYYSP